MAVATFTTAVAQSTSTLTVDVRTAKSKAEIYRRTDEAAIKFGRSMQRLMQGASNLRQSRLRRPEEIPLVFPTTIRLTPDATPPGRRSRLSAPLTLVFDTTGPYVFPSNYKTLLQNVFNAAKPFMDSTFGQPSVGGVVHVRDYELVIGDRQAVSGGYYTPNGPDGPEIRFPEYLNDSAVAVNFIHTLLLAYLGNSQYGFDAFQEGLVRAATAKIARTAALNGFDPDSTLTILENGYDVSPQYDWWNQRALGGPTFIAPNLLNVDLPVGGSVGGLYLLRYQMSGTAWQKLLVEYPTFISAFNAGFYANPALANDVPGLIALGQSVLTSLNPGNPTVEGLSFADWFKRQYILETKLTVGQKLLVQAIPVTTELSGSDFGKFIIDTHYFETRPNGDELLSSGVAYPIFWQDEAFNRVFPGSEERMNIAGAFGTIEPNFEDSGTGVPYRIALDMPVGDKLERQYLPAGAVATSSSSTINNLYGTVTGAVLGFSDTLKLRVNVNGVQLATVPVANLAFGTNLTQFTDTDYSRVTVDVVRTTAGVDTVLLTRKVNKGPGPLALDLRVGGEGAYTFPNGLPKGMSLIGFPVDPFMSLNSDVLGTAPNQTLVARYNPSKGRYDLFPEVEPFTIGHGYYVRSNVAVPAFSVEGRFGANVPVAVALKPGWNIVSSPLTEDVATSRIEVIRAANFEETFSQAQGIDIGVDFFGFNPGPNDPVTGAPEGGTLSSLTTFPQGKGVLVRVLAPEGVTLLFRPLQAGTIFHGNTLIAPPPPPTGWRMALSLKDTKNTAKVIIGQSQTATRGFDPREDSGMPPTMGGLQLTVQGTESFYRDIRAYGTETYQVRIDGLRAGTTYRLDSKMELGRAGMMTISDANNRPIKTIPAGSSFVFLATGASQTYKITVAGGSR